VLTLWLLLLARDLRLACKAVVAALELCEWSDECLPHATEAIIQSSVACPVRYDHMLEPTVVVVVRAIT